MFLCDVIATTWVPITSGLDVAELLAVPTLNGLFLSASKSSKLPRLYVPSSWGELGRGIQLEICFCISSDILLPDCSLFL